jgi:hypothetical protein
MLKTGIAYNNDDDLTEINDDELSKKLTTIHTKIGLVNYLNDNVTIKFGSELYHLNHKFSFSDNSINEEYSFNANDNLVSGFVEGDVKVSKNFALRLGGRGEYSDFTNEYNAAPRLSLAYKASKSSQFSMAYGSFYQQPQPDYLKYTNEVRFEKSDQYILNYQVKVDERLLRAEVYHKNYNNLITYVQNEFGEPSQIGNQGNGYANGIDVFWRDKKSLKYTDYWISYSFINSERKFKDYKKTVTPDFVAKHNFSIVYKRWLDKIRTQLSLSYNFSSGRYYYNPFDSEFAVGKTDPIHDLSGNMSYITHLFGNMTVVHLSVSNILGLEKTYGYRYTLNSENQDGYNVNPIKSMIQRTIILGMFISLK